MSGDRLRLFWPLGEMKTEVRRRLPRWANWLCPTEDAFEGAVVEDASWVPNDGLYHRGSPCHGE